MVSGRLLHTLAKRFESWTRLAVNVVLRYSRLGISMVVWMLVQLSVARWVKGVSRQACLLPLEPVASVARGALRSGGR